MLSAEVIRALEAIKLDPAALGKMFELEEQTDCPVTHHFGDESFKQDSNEKISDCLDAVSNFLFLPTEKPASCIYEELFCPAGFWYAVRQYKIC
jgi:hypothetical protein